MSAQSGALDLPAEPRPWPQLPLGAVVDVLDRRRKPITKHDRVAGPYPYYGATGVLDWVDDYLFDEPLVLIGEDGAKWEAGAKSAFAITGKTWVNNHAHVLRPNRDRLLDEWLIYYLNATDLSEFISGMTVPKLNQGRLREIPIPTPPLDEQKRIVAVLDQAFAALDRARTHATANLDDASRLLGACMADLFSNGDKLSSQEFGQVCKLEGGSQPPKSNFVRAERDGYIRLLQIRDFTSDDNAVYIPDDGKRRRCTKDDILIARYGASVGQIHTGKAGTYNVALIKATPNEKYLNPEYFYFYLKSDLFQKPLLAKSARGAQNGFNKVDVADIPVPVPDKENQANIVDQLRSMDEASEKLRSHYEAKLDEIDALKQSLLDQAFSGELT